MPTSRPDPALIAWEVPTQRPAESLTRSACLRGAVRWAILAPSRHNTQPWRFVLHDEMLDLRADRSRGLPVADPMGRELAIACGAALLNTRLALRHLGQEPSLQLLPDDGDPDLLARVTIGGPCSDPGADTALFVAISHRRTNRAEFEPRDVPDDLLGRLVEEAAAEGAWLHLLSRQSERWELAALVDEGDRIQYADTAFRHEVASWLRGNHESAPDGIRGYGFGMSEAHARASRFAVRMFNLGRSRGAHDRIRVEEAPMAAVLGTDDDAPSAWLHAGMALQRVLLRARSESVWAAFHSQPIEVPALRVRLARIVERLGHPQVVLRLGYGPVPLPEPRRPAEEVLTET